jgi:RHS repeat-associated protein
VNPAGSEYFLPDALGSVRQVVDASGTIVRTQSFDPYGNLLNSNGSTLTSYGFTGEWTDVTGLQYLRARYYSPVTGGFLSRDPFSGSLNQPATLNAYSYVGGNPVRYTDASGRCFDGISTVLCGMVLSAGAGALIGAGMDIGAQIINMHPQSPGQVFNCLNWSEVWVTAGAGAISGLAGVASFGAFTAIFGTSFIPTLGAGALSGVIAGQYSRLGQLGFSGQLSQAGEVMFRPKDMAIDAILGGFGGLIGYGLQRGLSGIAEDILQRVTDSANRKLATNLNLAQEVLTHEQYASGQRYPNVARMVYGNAVEGMTAQQISKNPLLSSVFEHVGGPYQPDFIGRGLFNGLNFDITTNTPRSITGHLSRAYGQGLIITTYSRPIDFGVFP